MIQENPSNHKTLKEQKSGKSYSKSSHHQLEALMSLLPSSLKIVINLFLLLNWLRLYDQWKKDLG